MVSMRLGSILMTLVAVGIAGLAGMMSKTWLEQQRRTSEPLIIEKSLPTNKIVVATQSLRYGQDLGSAHLKEIDWPAGNIPTGAFGSIGELLQTGERRVVLSAIEVNEPILKWKITGPGQRASLSALIEPGMKAVTVRVNDVLGVAGFVLPGDHVDVLMTKAEPANGSEKNLSKTFTDVLLQHVRVLGVDQLADDRTEKPSVVKAVTLELSIADAQKVTLAASMGTLSLMLRPAGSTQTARASRVTANEIEYEGGQRPATAKEPVVVSASQEPPRNRAVVITRAVRRFDYAVPIDGNTH
jgi:pilus assembly protein CpaB